MGLFSSIKENLSRTYSVIARADDTGDLPIWRHPDEEFRTGSILDVGEDDTALFYASGKIVGTFTGGRYSLETANYPFLDDLRAAFSGGEKSYKCRVIFINSKRMSNLRWGTQNPIPGNFTIANPWPGKPPYRVSAEIQAFGSYTVKITEPKLFLKEWGGTKATTRTKEELNEEVIRPMVLSVVTDNLVAAIQEFENGIWEIQKHKGEVSKRIEDRLDASFQEWGLKLYNFYIESISVKDSQGTQDWTRIKEAYTAFAAAQLEKSGEALGYGSEIDALGNNWQRIQARNIMQSMADNPGAGGVAATGAGLGMGMVAGGVMGSMAASMFAPMQEQSIPQPQPTVSPGPSRFAPKPAVAPTAPAPSQQIKCPHCGEIAGGGKFCGNCGQPLPQKCVCSSCGIDMPAGSKFCPHCGTKVN